MKVLHVNDSCDSRGGVQLYLRDVIGQLEKRGHESVVVCTEGRIDGLERRKAYRLGPEDSGRLKELIADERPDVAYVHHIHGPRLIETVIGELPTVAYVHGFSAVCPGLGKYYHRNNQVCGRPAGWACFPYHYSHRCSAGRYPPTILRLMQRARRLRRAYQQAKTIFVASRYMKELLIQNGYERRRLVVSPPHFVDDVPPYRPPSDRHLLLYVGRLEMEKGLTLLLRAFSRLPSETRLRIAGDGTWRAVLEQQAKSLGLHERVEFLGWIDGPDLHEQFEYGAALVLPSIAPEPFGKAGVEALTHGRPVVAFNVGGIPDWLQNGSNGWLVRPADVDHLVDTIRRIVEQPLETEEMGRRGQKLVENRFRAEEHMAQVMRAFTNAAGILEVDVTARGS